MQAEIEFRLHQDQRRVLKNSTRFTALRCGRKWGKSTFARYIVLDGASHDEKGAYIAPEYPYITDWWRDLSAIYHPIISKNNQQDKRIEFSNGASLDMWSLDNLNAIRPHEYDYVIIDEAALSRYLQEGWEQAIRPTLTKRRGRAWFLSTPKQGLGGKYYRSLCERNTDGWSSFHAPSHANPYLPIAELEAARQELPDMVFRQEYLAEFVDIDGSLVKRGMVQHGAMPDNIAWHMGVDLAISTKTHADYTAIAIVGRDKDNGRVYVADMYRGQITMHETIQKIKAYAEKWNVVRVAVEDVGYQAALKQELLRTAGSLSVEGVNPRKVKDITRGIGKMDSDKVRRFMPMLSRYEQSMVIHAPTLVQDFDNELLSFPDGEHDDMVDAMVYAYNSAVKGIVTGVQWV